MRACGSVMRARLSGKLVSLFSVGIRGAGLAMRFLLSFYIIKFLGYEAAGIYGLSLGAIGLSPAILGFGLNYFLARDVVGVEKLVSGIRVKSRLTVTTVALGVATALALLLSTMIGDGFKPIYVLIAILVWFETYSNDLHISLIAVELPFEANLLVFVKMALWVPVAIGLGLLWPAFRSIEVIFLCWIGSYVLYLGLLFWFIRGWPLGEVLTARIEYSWIRERASQSWFIYLSDLGMVGSMYVDRYVLSFMLGLKQTGLYTFYWSMTNALQTLVGTAVVQLALPSLYKAYRDGSVAKWAAELRRQIGKVVAFAGALAVCIFIAAEIIFRFMSMPELAQHQGVFIMLLAATITRSVSDVLNIGLMSIHKDKHYGYTNMAGVVLSAALTFTMISLFGFAGAGLGALLTSLATASIRGSFLLRFARGAAPAGNPPAGSRLAG